MKQNTRISTLNEYLTWVKSKQTLKYRAKGFPEPLSEDIRKNLYFRGQSDETWMITPALYRYHFKSEYEWLKTAEMRTWQETSNLSKLNKLIVFQHYGLNTRLLDVTRNPLVALYFACSSTPCANGAVYYGYKGSDDMIFAECLADILFSLPYPLYDSIPKQIVEEKIIERNIVAKENHPYLHDILCLPHFIEAPMNNPRISAQQGAFIMAPFLTEYKGKKGGDDSYCAHPQYEFKRSNQKEKDVFFKEDRAIILEKKKVDILKELDDIGINSSTLFQDMEHTLNAVNKENITGQWK